MKYLLYPLEDAELAANFHWWTRLKAENLLMRHPFIKHVCSASSKGRRRRNTFAHQKDANGVAGAVNVNRHSAVASLQQLAHDLPAQKD